MRSWGFFFCEGGGERERGWGFTFIALHSAGFLDCHRVEEYILPYQPAVFLCKVWKARGMLVGKGERG